MKFWRNIQGRAHWLCQHQHITIPSHPQGFNMDINPLTSDLKKHKEELLDSIEIAMGLDELNKADVH